MSLRTVPAIRAANPQTVLHRNAGGGQAGARGLMANPWGNGFDLTTMCMVINRTPPAPSQIGSLLPWKPIPISTRTFAIEDFGKRLEIVEAKPWGAAPSRKAKSKRGLRGLETLHHPYQTTLTPSEILARRAIGTELTPQTIEAARDDSVEEHKADHELTWERYRAFALRGLVPNKDGTVLYDLFDELKSQKTTAPLNLGDAKCNIRDFFTKQKRRIEKILASQYRIRGYVAICGSDAFDGITNHPSFVRIVERQDGTGSPLREDLRGGYTFLGNVTLVSYDFADYVPANMVLLCPIIDDFYVDVYAPMDSFETVGRLGLPMYSGATVSPDGKTMNIDSESNQMHFAAVPEAVVEITVTPAP